MMKRIKQLLILALALSMTACDMPDSLNGLLNSPGEPGNSHTEQSLPASSAQSDPAGQESGNLFSQDDETADESQESSLSLSPVQDMRMICGDGGSNEVSVIHRDGTVSTSVPAVDPSDWTDIVDLAGGYGYLLGLKADGTVVSTGEPKWSLGAIDTEGWTDITAISTHIYACVGLRSDGTAVFAGDILDGERDDLMTWTDLKKVCIGEYFLAGLKNDGTVVTSRSVIDPYYNRDSGQFDTESWTEIVDLAVGDNHTVGLRSDGTVVATGMNIWGACEVSDWRDIVAVDAGSSFTVGLKSDGTVLLAGHDNYNMVDKVRDWTNVVALDALSQHVIGLLADGTIVHTGAPTWGKAASGWTDIRMPE